MIPRSQGANRSWHPSAPVAVGLALMLFAGIFVLRLVDKDEANGTLVLLVLPIALCALRFGVRGGVAAAALGIVVVIAWDIAGDVYVGPLGYAARGAAFLILGVVLGRFVNRRTALEQRVRRHFDTSPDLLATADFGGYFKELNPAWETTLGYTRQELTSNPFVEFVHPDDRQRTVAEAARLEQPGTETVNFKNRYRAHDGSYRWLDWSSRSMPEEGLIYAIARDISAQIEAEQAAKEAQDLAERANRAKSEFLSRMSHELRTPLNAVLGFGQLLQAQDLDPDKRESVGQIMKGGRHLLELITKCSISLGSRPAT